MSAAPGAGKTVPSLVFARKLLERSIELLLAQLDRLSRRRAT